MNDHRELYAKDDSMRQFTALARFRVAEAEIHGRSQLDLSRSRALLARIGEFAPEIEQDEEPVQDSGREAGVEIPRKPVTQRRRVSRATVEAATEERPDDPDPASRDVIGVAVDAPAVAQPAGLPLGEPAEADDVLVLDPDRPGRVKPCTRMADPAVVGVATVVAGAGTQVAVATSGIVTVKVDTSFGAILAGDLLIASPTPGHAMRTIEALPGTILGKALEPLEIGTGSIRVLVTLR